MTPDSVFDKYADGDMSANEAKQALLQWVADEE